MDKKNVLIVLTVPLEINGINIATLGLLENIDASRYRFFVLSTVSSDEWSEKAFSSAGCTVLKEEYRDKRPLEYYGALKRIIRENDIDIVHAMGNSGTLAVEMLAAKSCNVKIRIAHSHTTSCNHKFFDKLLRPFLYGSCNRRIACGKDAGKWLFKNRDFIVLKNGKDYEKYAFSVALREKYRKEWGISDDTLLICHVGVFIEEKNHAFMLEIAEQLKDKNVDFVMVFIGDGDGKEKIERGFKERGLEDNSMFLGSIENVGETLSAFDAAILPSKSEGLPGVATEWQINGLPCFISDRVTRECAINENVFFLPIDDARLWAERIVSGEAKRLFDSDTIKKRLKEHGFDLMKNAKLLSDVYDGEAVER